MHSAQADFFAPPCNFGATHDDGKRKRDRKLLEDAAKAAGLSISRTRQLFRAEMNITLKQYADKLRMERAREMAKELHVTIDQILAEIGVGDNSHFRRKLKRTYGRTLSEYRRFGDEQAEKESGHGDGDKK